MPNGKVLDSAWIHGTVVVEGDFRRVKCNYCSQEISGGITCLKKHLARVGGCVKPCPSVPKSVLNGFRENFEEIGPNKTMTLKSNQKRVPLCEGQTGNPTNVNTDDGTPEPAGMREGRVDQLRVISVTGAQHYLWCTLKERRMKNGKVLDSAWLHGTVVVEGKFRKIRCKYCSKVLNSGITGLKRHLARIDVGVTPCPSVPQAVSDGFRENYEETGPYKYPSLKKNQKKVPLCEGQSGDPTSVDGTPEEHGEHCVNAGPNLLVTKNQSSPSNSGHTTFMKGMSASRGKTGSLSFSANEVAERVAECHNVNSTEGDRSQVRTRTHSSQISSDFTPIINVEDSSSDDETGPHTSLMDPAPKKRRVDDAFGPEEGLCSSDTLLDDAFGPEQGLCSSDTLLHNPAPIKGKEFVMHWLLNRGSFKRARS